jgi:hypothetical protein
MTWGTAFSLFRGKPMSTTDLRLHESEPDQQDAGDQQHPKLDVNIK